VSYLLRPRLNFVGSFEADVSTVNNDPTHFNTEKFLPNFDDPQTQQSMNGWWNPSGTGIWRLFDCSVTGVCYANGTNAVSADQDAVVGMSLVDAGDRAPAKLVDLDPQQQMVSTIFGLQLRLVTQDG
jgi:hypothetical protein